MFDETTSNHIEAVTRSLVASMNRGHAVPTAPYVLIDDTDRCALRRLRRRAHRAGFRVEKGRGHQHSGQLGGLMLINAGNNVIVDGPDYGLTIARADEILSELIALN